MDARAQNLLHKRIFSASMFDNAAEECTRSARTETDYIKDIAEYLPDSLNGSSLLFDERRPDEVLRFFGAYMHQKPRVKFKLGESSNVGSCELGDLMFVLEDVAGGDNKYNVVLFQAKCLSASQRHYSITPGWNGDGRQLKLYTTWPRLGIAAKIYNGLTFSVSPKTASPGAEYLLIGGSGSSKFTVSSPQKVMTVENLSIGEFMRLFIDWQTGRPISLADDSASDDWSRLIWSALELVKCCQIPGRASKRLAPELLCLHSGAQSMSHFDEDYSDCCDVELPQEGGFAVFVIRRERLVPIAFEI